MKKGFIGGFAGAFTAIILVVIILIFLAYTFAPNYMPNSPCLLDSNCAPQKLCCTWRCDSMELKWWNCPDAVCSLLGTPDEPTLKCGCSNLKCKYIEPSEQNESKGFFGIFKK